MNLLKLCLNLGLCLSISEIFHQHQYLLLEHLRVSLYDYSVSLYIDFKSAPQRDSEQISFINGSELTPRASKEFQMSNNVNYLWESQRELYEWVHRNYLREVRSGFLNFLHCKLGKSYKMTDIYIWLINVDTRNFLIFWIYNAKIIINCIYLLRSIFLR